jgi:hypothetical protein
MSNSIDRQECLTYMKADVTRPAGPNDNRSNRLAGEA